MFSFSMALSVEVGESVAAYSELFDESKSTFFLELVGLQFYFDSMTQKYIFQYSLDQWYSTFFTQSSLFGKRGSKLPPESIDEQT